MDHKKQDDLAAARSIINWFLIMAVFWTAVALIGLLLMDTYELSLYQFLVGWAIAGWFYFIIAPTPKSNRARFWQVSMGGPICWAAFAVCCGAALLLQFIGKHGRRKL